MPSLQKWYYDTRANWSFIVPLSFAIVAHMISQAQIRRLDPDLFDFALAARLNDPRRPRPTDVRSQLTRLELSGPNVVMDGPFAETKEWVLTAAGCNERTRECVTRPAPAPPGR